MGYLQWYVAEETAGEYKSGHINYSELLRRLTLLPGSAVAALALAVTLGCSAATPTAPAAPPPSATSAPAATLAPTATARPTTPPATAAPTNTSPVTPTAIAATAGASPTVPPFGTVTADDAAITGAKVTWKNGDVTLMGYLAKPKAAGPRPAVLVIHENRGLSPHFEDVSRRLAKAGYVALAIDLLSREGGTANLADPGSASATLGRAGDVRLTEDMNGGIKYLQSLQEVRADRIGAMGFCFGGGMAWLIGVRNPDVKAIVPFYGPRPPLAEIANLRGSALGLYGANDNFINGQVPDLESALKTNNKTYKMVTYQGAGHAFFNDTGASFNTTAAQAAWPETISWFRLYLGS